MSNVGKGNRSPIVSQLDHKQDTPANPRKSSRKPLTFRLSRFPSTTNVYPANPLVLQEQARRQNPPLHHVLSVIDNLCSSLLALITEIDSGIWAYVWSIPKFEIVLFITVSLDKINSFSFFSKKRYLRTKENAAKA